MQLHVHVLLVLCIIFYSMSFLLKGLLFLVILGAFFLYENEFSYEYVSQYSL